MIEVLEVPGFAERLRGLRDKQAQSRIAKRITRIRGGGLGDVKSVGAGTSEVRIDHGPGYRSAHGSI